MTLAAAIEIVETWDETPPAFMSLANIEAMLAAFFGVKKRRGQSGQLPPGPSNEAAEWRARLGSGDVHAGMRETVVLDFTALKERTHG